MKKKPGARSQKPECGSRRVHILCSLFWILAPGFCIPSGASAQPSNLYNRDFNQVYVRDSAVAMEKFALAERLERLREWSKAGDVYQDILTNYADRVVASASDPSGNGQVIQYTSVIPAVQEHLA